MIHISVFNQGISQNLVIVNIKELGVGFFGIRTRNLCPKGKVPLDDVFGESILDSRSNLLIGLA